MALLIAGSPVHAQPGAAPSASYFSKFSSSGTSGKSKWSGYQVAANKKKRRARRSRRSTSSEGAKKSSAAEKPKPPVKKIEGTKPLDDRWRILYQENLIDPYNQNVLKGDRPIIGQDIFFVLRMDSISKLEWFGNVPTPSGVSAADPIREEFFGGNRKSQFVQDFRFTLELFKGDTSFRPRDWEIRLVPVININHLDTSENGIVSLDVREGTDRNTTDAALEEASVEYHLGDLTRYFDFASVKAGIQKFNSDFRGIIFEDANLGVRLLGTAQNNIFQYNFLYFDMLEKDTNSELNTFEDRNQEVIIANVYWQDFLVKGYTAQLSFHYNEDGPSTEFDKNLFLVRPDLLGTVTPHEVKSKYIGWTGEGHWGRVNLSHFFYYAFGSDSFNNLAGKRIDIEAFALGAELSVDQDWVRYRFSFLHGSGDGDADDDVGKGFDAIFPNPNFVGGRNGYWISQAIPLAGTRVQLVNKDSVFPSLRSSKIQGQSNFVNPGITFFNVGLDLNLTPKVRSTLNLSKLQFDDTNSIELALNQGDIDKDIGYDLSLGVEWRPWLNNNVILDLGTSVFFPGAGFRDILTPDKLFAITSRIILTY
ncbi:MAG: hypothetical protein ACE5ER_06145 [Nitrospinaceae bacterium]